MKVKNCYRITYDSYAGNAFDVHLGDGKLRKFCEKRSGLYYSNMREHGARENHSFINTVQYNKSRYNFRDYLRAVDSMKTTKHYSWC